LRFELFAPISDIGGIPKPPPMNYYRPGKAQLWVREPARDRAGVDFEVSGDMARLPIAVQGIRALVAGHGRITS